MKKIFIPFFLTLLLISFSFSQKNPIENNPLAEVQPETQGFISNRLNRIDNMLHEYVEKKQIAGAIALITKNGKIVYYKAIGYDDIDKGLELKKDNIFRIASQSKAITSVGIMILYEQGKLMLDDPVSKYIPEYKSMKVLDKFNESDTTYTTTDAKRSITIRDLLTHTSGIGYAQIGTKTMNAIYAKAGVGSGLEDRTNTLKEQMQKLARAPLMHQPGEKFTYGLNTDLLGYLIEVISGTPLDTFLKQNIFEPLGMNDTYFSIPKEKQARLAILYTEDSLKNLKKFSEKRANSPFIDNKYFSGGGGLVSTALDYTKFTLMLLNNGEFKGNRILSRNSVRLMTTNQIGDLFIGGQNKFGLGFGIVTKEGSAKTPTPEGTFWWGGIFGSDYWIDVKENITAQIVLQKYPNSYSNILQKFKNLVYQSFN